jgi:hypothetical protein
MSNFISKETKTTKYNEEENETTFYGNGQTTVFNIRHGLGREPLLINSRVRGLKKMIRYNLVIDKVNIVLTFEQAPPEGSFIVKWTASL